MPEKSSKKTNDYDVIDEIKKETKKALEYLRDIREDVEKKRQIA